MITADGRLKARDKASDAALRAALLSASGPRRPGTRDVSTLAVHRRSGMAVVARTVPISAISANPFFDAKLLVIFGPVEMREPDLSAERIQDVLKVTPAESRLLRALHLGETVRSAAEALGIATMTARTQLKSVYGKLDIHNQRDLVAVLARI